MMELKNINISFLRKTNMNGWYEFTKMACPVCGHKGQCIVSFKKGQIICSRANADTVFDNKKGYKTKIGFKFVFNNKSVANKTIIKTTMKVENQHLFKKANADHLDKVYRCVLNHATVNGKRLMPTAYDDLKRRGLSDETINRELFASTSNVYANAIHDQNGYIYDENRLITNFTKWFSEAGLNQNSWQGVPGFYKWQHLEKTGKAETVLFNLIQEKNNKVFPQFNLPKQDNTPTPKNVINENYYIPVRNIDGKIVGMQVRNMQHETNGYAKYMWVSSSSNFNGTGAGNPLPINVAVAPILDTSKKAVKDWLYNGRKTVILTEGILKSIVTAELLPTVYSTDELRKIGTVVLGNGGVSQWRQFLPTLQQLNAKRVIIAYDMDYENNAQVKQARNDLIKELLKAKDYEVCVANWNDQYKGIDDFLLAKQNNHNLKMKISTFI